MQCELNSVCIVIFHVLIFLLSSSKGTLRNDYLIFHATPATWTDARKTCQLYNGTLLDIKGAVLEENLISLRHHIRLLNHSDDLAIWVDNHTVLSSWFSYEGCFKNYGSQNQHEVSIVDVYSVHTCSIACRNIGYSYFGLETHRCFCYSDLSKEVKVQPINCHITCDNEARSACGGISTVSIYKYYSAADDDLLRYRRCATVSCPESGQLQIRAQYCNTSYQALCASGKVIEKRGRFAEGKRKCTKYGGLHSLGNETICSQLPNLQRNRQYWLSLTRYEFPSSDAAHPFKCTKAKYDGRQIELSSVSCRRSQQFACRTDINNRQLMCENIQTKSESNKEIEVMYRESPSVQHICNDIDVRKSYMSRGFYESGFIAIIVCCGVIVLWCLITMICCCRKKKRKQNQNKDKNDEIPLKDVKYKDINTEDNVEPIEETLE